MRRRGIATTVLAVGVIALMAACTSSSGGGGGTAAQAAGATAPATVEVMLSDFEISPKAIQAPADVPLEFSVMNHGPSQHTFGIVVNGSTLETDPIDAGKIVQLDVPALAAGTYQALCTIPGHDALGMKATVTASADAAAAASGTSTDGSTDTATAPSAGMSAADMASMHEQGVKDFLAGNQTDTVGGRVLEPTIDHGVKVFSLTIEQVQWEVSKGVFKPAMAFNGTVPGPEIRVRQGDRVRFVFRNLMDQPTIVHFHGMTVPNSMDGVPFVTAKPAMPGHYLTYEFTIKDPPGMYVYHSHFNSTEQVGSGLYGAVIVLPKTGSWRYPTYTVDRMGYLHQGAPAAIDDEYTMFLGDGPLGYVLNGKSFPATAPLVAKQGDWVLIHLANDGSMLHPMHLHGYHFEVVAQDGFPLDQPYLADTLVIAPGQRFDVLVHAVYPGAWAFHCHILPHVEGPQGMYGMVTALVVQ
jgi:FtsP/CotA-like multicopper oxidase with cupredoxin domain